MMFKERRWRGLWSCWVRCSSLVLVLFVLYRMGAWKSAEVHVMREGNDWSLGTARYPVRTIQAALDRVAPGGTVIVQPGTYYERVHIRCGGDPLRPTVLKAAVPGRVVLSWYTEPIRLEDSGWERHGRYLVRSVDWPVSRVMVDDLQCFRVVSGLKGLDQLTKLSGAMPAFTYQNGELFLFVPATYSSYNTMVVWNRAVPDPREWGEFRSANVWIEAGHVRLEGLDMRCGIGSSVRLWNGSNVTIVDCAMSGANVGINAAEGVVASDRLRVERCLYHNYPQFDWRREWLDWPEVYAHYSTSTLIKAIDLETSIENNVVVHCGDGMQLSSRSAAAVSIRAADNWIALATDDALEAEGHVAGVTFTENVVLNAHESLGLSPVTTGPLVISRNLFLHPQVEFNGAQLKFVPPERRRTELIRNIDVFGNQFVGNWLCWYRPDVRIQNVRIRENRFVVRRQNVPQFPAGVDAVDNVVLDLPFDAVELSPAVALGALDQPSVVELRRHAGPTWWDWTAHPATRELASIRETLRQVSP